MVLNKKYIISFFFLLLVLFIVYVLRTIPSNTMNSELGVWVAFRNIYLCVSHFFCLSLFLAYLYQCWDVTRRFYFALNIYDCSMLMMLAFMIIYFIPVVIGFNLVFLMFHVCLSNYPEISLLAPNAEDFIVLVLNNNTVNEIPTFCFPKSPDTVISGTLEGGTRLGSVILENDTDYVCVDIKKMIDKAISPKELPVHNKFLKFVLKYYHRVQGDFICSGLPFKFFFNGSSSS